MFRSLNVAASGMSAEETELDTIANNLANANTTGFKAQNAQFEDLLYQNVRGAGPQSDGTVAPTNAQIGSGVRVVATTRSFAQGTLQQTNNPLDLAIQGQGFFAVLPPTGQVAYTRAGSFQLDSQGRVTTSDGYVLQPPITIPSDATSVTITADGTVSAVQPGQSHTDDGRADPDHDLPQPERTRAPTGNNVFTATAASGEALTGAAATDGRGTVLQGSIEGSNVDVVDEMVALIRTQRNYEINSKVISAADEMLRTATQNQ